MPLHAKPNKPIYVRKYDFLRSFFRPESHWFWPTTKIDEELSELIRATNSDYVSETEDDDGEGEFSTYDSLEEFLTLKEENISKNIDMDENDPKIIEGQILDELAKKHIIEEYELCEVIDFDCKEYKQKALDELCEITISILRDKNNVILFQPTFIAKNKAIAKPDAIVIFNSKTYLIETKGSAKVKASHIIDLIYQDKVVNDCLRQNDLCEIDDFYMCIVATERAKKGEVTFILTNNICFNKSGSQSGISQLKKMGIDKFDPEYLAYKQQICIANSPFDENPTFTYNDFRYKLNDLINQIIPEKLEKFYNVYDDRNFWDTIDIIIGHQPTSDLNFEPEEKFSCFFKDNDNILSLKNYYYTTSVYHSFGYSGYLIPWKRSFELAQFYNQKKTYSPHDVLLIAKDHIKSKIFDRISNFIQLDDKIFLSSYAKGDFEKKSKQKNVYFDFETLNTPVRVIDDTVAYLQVVNQVSIITDNNTQPIDTLECNNIVIDPKIISINDFKYIIDQILKDVVGDVDEYNFVVYNVSFEKSRLNEMKILINEQEYNEKVDKIVKNLFDLANYFDIRKKECIYVWSLKGYYSIKKVLDMIMKEQPHIFNLTGCKNYKQLKIGNGLQAQSASTLRFFDRITTNQWKEKVDDLKIYCENDVRAMIAVEQWIKMMINSQEKTKIIEPSLLPLLNSGAKEAHEKIIKLKEAGIEQFHYDVMEMGFVKNTSFDDEYLKFLWDNDLLANIHLMVLAPLEYIKKYAKYKPNSITFHVETQSISESIQLLELIRQYNIKSGISIKYSSKLEQYEELIPYCDYINIMSVEPGKGGQTFDEKCLENLEQANKYKDQYPFLTIQNDGGMNLQLAEKYFHLINNFIMGSFVFNDIDNVNEIIAKFNSFN